MTEFPREEAPPWDPGRSRGIIGLIFSLSGIFCGVIGLVGAVISLTAFLKSRKAGYSNRFALAGIIVGVALFVIWLVLFSFVPVPVPGR